MTCQPKGHSSLPVGFRRLHDAFKTAEPCDITEEI